MSTETRDKIPGFSLKEQMETLEPELLEAMRRVIRSGQFIQGPEVQALEAEMEALLGVPVVGVANGSDALYLSLAALGVGPGDTVVTTPFTFFATAGSILRTGARPVFADVDPDTFNLDPDQALSRVTPRTRAILPVHLFGLMADIEALERGFSGPIVEDAAQAILATQNGRVAGTVGALGCFSLFPTKNLGALGDAGLVTSRVPELLEKVRTLRVHGASRKYYHEMLGINSRLDAVQAALVRVKLPHLPAWTARREGLAQRYTDGLASLGLAGQVQRQAVPAGFRHVYHQYTVRVERRDELQQYLASQGIGSTVYYPHPLHLMPVFADLGHRPGDFPVAEELSRSVLSLPLYPELTEAQVDRVVERLGRFYRG
jgi:dTDP-4-amino-4,6-dideoxygalactose transaminase